MLHQIYNFIYQKQKKKLIKLKYRNLGFPIIYEKKNFNHMLEYSLYTNVSELQIPRYIKIAFIT